MATLRAQKTQAKQRKRRTRRVRVGTADHRLTRASGVEAVRELDRVLGICAALEAGEGDPAGLAGEFDAAVATLKAWQERQLSAPA